MGEYFTFVVINVEKIHDDVYHGCGSPMGSELYKVTYLDHEGPGCDVSSYKQHWFIGNACWGDPQINNWPACNSGFIIVVSGSNNCHKADFLNNCCCP
jgi:hypothetical protein